MTHPLFEIVTTTAGAISIRNKVLNETMHNPVGPWVEANALYIEQSQLMAKLQQNLTKEFVIFDVGLGAAANALAALVCFEKLKEQKRPLRLISFEKDLELLRFAVEHASSFSHFKGYEPALKQILDTGSWSNGLVNWELREGDFLQLIAHEPYRPHLVFYDPYSPKVNQEMWTVECFSRLRQKCREKEDGGTELFTYSRATRIRAALIIAGFYIGQGQATGLKDETTQAATVFNLLHSPLDQAWFQRWSRSHSRQPFDCKTEDESKWDEIVESYFQDRLTQVARPT